MTPVPMASRRISSRSRKRRKKYPIHQYILGIRYRYHHRRQGCISGNQASPENLGTSASSRMRFFAIAVKKDASRLEHSGSALYRTLLERYKEGSNTHIGQ